MRIVIMVFVGIISYLVVVLPGYYFIVPEGTEKISNLVTLKELPTENAAKSKSKLSVANPGDAPVLK